jgi:hypothetical protein
VVSKPDIKQASLARLVLSYPPPTFGDREEAVLGNPPEGRWRAIDGAAPGRVR